MRLTSSVCKVTDLIVDNFGSILNGNEYFLPQHIMNGFRVN